MKKRFLLFFNLLKTLKIDWEKWGKRSEKGYLIAWRLLVISLVIGFIWFIISGLYDNGYAIQAFSMPKSFSDSGYTGTVMARKLVDELSDVEAFVSSIKEDALEDIQNLNDKPDLDVEVMGIGLTLNSITYHLRELLGRPNRSIGGEVTDIDQILSLNLRITGSPVRSFSYNYEDSNRSEAINALVHEAAKAIIKNLDPYRLAVYHYKNEDTKNSLKTIDHIIKEKPEDAAWAYLAWGNLLDKEGDLMAACEKFKLATDINPAFTIAWRNWAWLEFRQRNYDKSIELMEKALATNKKDGEGWNSLAYCLRQVGRYEEADAAYKKAIKYDKGNINWYANWADYKAMQEDTAAVLDIFEQMQKNIQIKDSDYYSNISTYHRFKGNLDSTFFYLETALALDPDNLAVNNQLANYYYFAVRDTQKAMTAMQKVAQLAETSNLGNANFLKLNAHNNIAMFYCEKEQFDSAYSHVNQAIRLNPEVNFPYATLAEIHANLGNEEGLLEALEMAMERGFDIEPYLDQPPFNKYKDQEQFKALVEKYDTK